MKAGYVAVLLLFIAMFGIIANQQHTINALIELNHSKSVYIDAGCNGRYQGAEELLPNELPGDRP